MSKKKKFKETKVGQFLSGAGSTIIDSFGEVLPDKGIMGVVKNLIKKDPALPAEDKEKALALLHQDTVEMQEVTKRWESDMSSNSWLSSNIRPLSLAFLTLALFIYVILDSSLDTFKIDEQWISLLGNLLMLVYGGYFGARTLEKIRHK